MKLVPLTRGAFAIVDDDDWAEISKYTWHAHCHGEANIYACTMIAGRRSKVRMHRLLLSPPDGMDIDHINGQTLDNRRCNLRVCTRRENARNQRKGTRKKNLTSQFKGVSYFVYVGKKRTRKQWRVSIRVGEKSQHVGVFNSEEEAARAYDTAAKQFFGPLARLNFPNQENALPSASLSYASRETNICPPQTSPRRNEPPWP